MVRLQTLVLNVAIPLVNILEAAKNCAVIAKDVVQSAQQSLGPASENIPTMPSTPNFTHANAAYFCLLIFKGKF